MGDKQATHTPLISAEQTHYRNEYIQYMAFVPGGAQGTQGEGCSVLNTPAVIG